MEWTADYVRKMCSGTTSDIRVLAKIYVAIERMYLGLNIFYSWQNMTKDWAEQKSYV